MGFKCRKVKVDLKKQVKQIDNILEDWIGIPSVSLALLNKGIRISEDKTFEELGIKSKDIVIVSMSLKGGWRRIGIVWKSGEVYSCIMLISYRIGIIHLFASFAFNYGVVSLHRY